MFGWCALFRCFPLNSHQPAYLRDEHVSLLVVQGTNETRHQFHGRLTHDGTTEGFDDAILKVDTHKLSRHALGVGHHVERIAILRGEELQYPAIEHSRSVSRARTNSCKPVHPLLLHHLLPEPLIRFPLGRLDKFVEDVDIIKKLIVIAVPIVACINVLIAFRTIRILGRLEDGVEVEGW